MISNQQSTKEFGGSVAVKYNRGKWFKAVVAVPVLFLLLLWLGPSLMTSFRLAAIPYGNKWYAVYLDNGQALYGRIAGMSWGTLKMRDVYYLQTVQVGEESSSNLVKRGTNEITAPENALFVNRSQVLYFEPIGKDAPVMKIINSK